MSMTIVTTQQGTESSVCRNTKVAQIKNPPYFLSAKLHFTLEATIQMQITNAKPHYHIDKHCAHHLILS